MADAAFNAILTAPMNTPFTAHQENNKDIVLQLEKFSNTVAQPQFIEQLINEADRPSTLQIVAISYGMDSNTYKTEAAKKQSNLTKKLEAARDELRVFLQHKNLHNTKFHDSQINDESNKALNDLLILSNDIKYQYHIDLIVSAGTFDKAMRKNLATVAPDRWESLAEKYQRLFNHIITRHNAALDNRDRQLCVLSLSDVKAELLRWRDIYLKRNSDACKNYRTSNKKQKQEIAVLKQKNKALKQKLFADASPARAGLAPAAPAALALAAPPAQLTQDGNDDEDDDDDDDDDEDDDDDDESDEDNESDEDEENDENDDDEESGEDEENDDDEESDGEEQNTLAAARTAAAAAKVKQQQKKNVKQQKKEKKAKKETKKQPKPKPKAQKKNR